MSANPSWILVSLSLYRRILHHSRQFSHGKKRGDVPENGMQTRTFGMCGCMHNARVFFYRRSSIRLAQICVPFSTQSNIWKLSSSLFLTDRKLFIVAAEYVYRFRCRLRYPTISNSSVHGHQKMVEPFRPITACVAYVKMRPTSSRRRVTFVKW